MQVGRRVAPDPDCFSADGSLVGTSVEGTSDGILLGRPEGVLLGSSEDSMVGSNVGCLHVGRKDGAAVGSRLGSSEGISDGRPEGVELGSSDSTTVGVVVNG